MAVRARWYKIGIFASKNLPCKVISIGNIVAGGTGKTPTTIGMANQIRGLGYRVVVISRGYGGKLEKKGGIVSDGENILRNSRDAGDEPYLMAKCLKGIPVVVGSSRYKAGQMAVQHFNPDVIILDDAFQHLRLHRDLNLVLLDYKEPFGNGHILPRGTLRESNSALRRADAVIITRSHAGDLPAGLVWLPESLPIYNTRHELVIRRFGQEEDPFITKKEDISYLKGKKALVFAGLANNGQFFKSLQEVGCNLLHTLSYSDHHRYDRSELDRIAGSVTSCNADVIVTTLKDAVKLEMNYSWPVELVVVDATIQFHKNSNSFFSIIIELLEKE
jgi:tetraacyldisaccharide 4'-kinase